MEYLPRNRHALLGSPKSNYTQQQWSQTCVFLTNCDFTRNFLNLGRGICGSFFLWLSTSRSQVVIKKSSHDNFFHSKWRLSEKMTSFYWKFQNFGLKTLSFDDFLMTTWEPEVESQRKKEPQIPRLGYLWKLQIFMGRMKYAGNSSIFQKLFTIPGKRGDHPIPKPDR